MHRKTDAAQFMPFAALTGYEKTVRQQEHQKEVRRMVSDERAQHIMRMFARLNKGDAVQVTYYNKDAYTQVNATLRQIDTTYHILEVTDSSSSTIKQSCLRIPFEDIWDIDWG